MHLTERVCLPVGGLGYSSERVRVNECAYQLVGLDTVLSECGLPVGGLGFLDAVLSRCAWTGVHTSWWAWIQWIQF